MAGYMVPAERAAQSNLARETREKTREKLARELEEARKNYSEKDAATVAALKALFLD